MDRHSHSIAKGSSGIGIGQTLLIQGMAGLVHGTGKGIKGIVLAETCRHPRILSMTSAKRVHSYIEATLAEIKADGRHDFPQEGFLFRYGKALENGSIRLIWGGNDFLYNGLEHRLQVSKEGLAERDRMVLARCREMGLPVATVMAGGYGRRVEDTVEIHLQTVRIAAEFSTRGRSNV